MRGGPQIAEEYDGREKVFVTIPPDFEVANRVREVARRHILFPSDHTHTLGPPRGIRLEFRPKELVDPRTYEQEWMDAGAIKVEYYAPPSP